ncbi:MAG: hypothetical protein HRU21_07930 [Pseudomonadales bacterium]|nr:hypothetical protein [Pseudomonadales bacterium]
MIKPVREGWIAISDIPGISKVEVKAYSSFLQSVLLLFIVGWYAKLSDKLDKLVLFRWATLFCISNIVIFWLLQPDFIIAKSAWIGFAYYLWVGMFGVFVVAQFWTFCADLFTSDTGNRLMPVIAIGATSGAVIGSWLVSALLHTSWFNSDYLLVLATVPLLASIFLMQQVGRQSQQHTAKASAIEPAKLWVGVKLICNSRFLLLAAVVTVLSNWVNTNGENLLFSVVQVFLQQQAIVEQISSPAAVNSFINTGTTAFYGDFFFWVNLFALLLQAFVASRLLKYGGFAAVLLLLPVIAIASYVIIFLAPVLYIVKVMKILENATDYSINNTSRQVLWLPIASQTKFHAKPAIDTLYCRLGDGLAALTVFLGVHVYIIPLKYLIAFNLALVVLWLMSAVALAIHYKRLVQSNDGPKQPPAINNENILSQSTG